MSACYALVLTPELQDALPSLLPPGEGISRSLRTVPTACGRPVQLAVVDGPTLDAISRAMQGVSQALLRDADEGGLDDGTRRARRYAAELVRGQAKHVEVAVARARATPVEADAPVA